MNLGQAKVYAREQRDATADKREWMRWENVLARLVSTRAAIKVNAIEECEKHQEEQSAGRNV